MAMGLVNVLQQSFQIAGDTFMPMVVTLAAMWFVEVPGAMALSGAADQIHPLGLNLPVPTIGSLGHYGVAWAITLAAFFRLSCYLPYFAWGPWWKKRVIDVPVPAVTGL
jgi:Na+-driven multidrug efflux pump